MSVQLSNQSECLREYGEVTYSASNLVAHKLKKMRDVMMTVSPILWVLFFLVLAVLINFVAGR